LVKRMMKANFKRFEASVAAGVLLANLILPASLFAQTSATGGTSSQTGATEAKRFCARVSALTSSVDKRLDGRLSKLSDAQGKRDKNIANRRTRRDERLKENRARWIGNRDAQFTKLEAHASTTEQKQAIEAFKMAITAAISTRHTAVDAAISAFRTGVDQAIAQRKTVVDAAIKTFEDSTKMALDKAKADCAAGSNPEVVRQTLMTSMKNARTKLQSDRKAVDTIGTNLTQLTATRKAAVDKAFADFKTAAEKARKDLKAALGK